MVILLGVQTAVIVKKDKRKSCLKVLWRIAIIEFRRTISKIVREASPNIYLCPAAFERNTTCIIDLAILFWCLF